MSRGLPISSEEFEVLVLQTETEDVDIDAFSNRYFRVRNTLVLLAVLCLILWVFVGITVLFTLPFDSLEQILFLSFGNLIFSLFILTIVNFFPVPGFAVLVFAVVVLVLEFVQIGTRTRRIISPDGGCQASCGFGEYVYFFYGLAFVFISVGFVLGSWVYWNTLVARQYQRNELIAIRTQNQIIGSSTPLKTAAAMSTSTQLRRRTTAMTSHSGLDFPDDWQMKHR